MHPQITCWRVSLFFLVSLHSSAVDAAITDYDASSGLLPQSVGWSFVDNNNPASTVGVSGGVLTLNSTLANRAFWQLNPVPGTPGDHGVFMETTMQVISERHSSTGRGVALPQVGHADGVYESNVDLYAWQDRINLNDFSDSTVGTHFMDTTDGPHTYRVELLLSDYWVFVDDQLVLSGTTPVAPSAVNGIRGAYGDTSTFTSSVTEWSRVRIGSLDDIGGPTVPEPSSVLLGIIWLGSLLAQRSWLRLRE